MPQQPIDLPVLVAATASTPDHTYRSPDGRYLMWYWILPGTEPDHSGCRPTAKLTVEHDKAGKRYKATLSRTDFALADGLTREAFGFLREQRGLLVRTDFTARFSAARFAAFVQAAQQDLATARRESAA